MYLILVGCGRSSNNYTCKGSFFDLYLASNSELLSLQDRDIHRHYAQYKRLKREHPVNPAELGVAEKATEGRKKPKGTSNSNLDMHLLSPGRNRRLAIMDISLLQKAIQAKADLMPKVPESRTGLSISCIVSVYIITPHLSFVCVASLLNRIQLREARRSCISSLLQPNLKPGVLSNIVEYSCGGYLCFHLIEFQAWNFTVIFKG